ncbi:MAG: AsmA family protein, partial [Alphaproteobacteria bacterium]|nr:AsmA family protein [Alphaproteobacteria bacterium]
MPRNRLLALALALLGLIVVLGGIGIAALLTIDFRPIIERQASRALQRQLTIGALEIGWGDPLRITLHDLRFANMAGGSEADMVTIGRLDAAIGLRPLLHGALRYDRLRLEGARILLERNAAGEPNWRFPSGGSPSPGGLALVPKDRSQF